MAAVGLSLISLLSISACSAGQTTARHASNTTVRASAVGNLTVVVQAANGRDLTLYRIDRFGTARKIRTVPTPASARNGSFVTLSAGVDPAMCVDWETLSPEVRCWASTASPGPGVPVPVADVLGVALSADGSHLLTGIDSPPNGMGEIQLWSLATGRAAQHGQTDVSLLAAHERCGKNWSQVEYLSWIGGANVVLTCADPPPDVVEVPLHALLTGTARLDGYDIRPAGPGTHGYNTYEDLTLVTGDTALAVLADNIFGCANDYCPPRIRRLKFHPSKAVLLDVRNGRVLETYSAPGDEVDSVSGGADGVVYTVNGPGRPRTYVRWPGRTRSTLVVGLPAPYEGDMDNRVTTAEQ